MYYWLFWALCILCGMSIKSYSKLTFAIALCVTAGACLADKSNEKPNIIFILTDDISPRDYALYGGKIESPVLEKMAEQGLCFETAWATPRCMPTRGWPD
jgi:hypothetical protein